MQCRVGIVHRCIKNRPRCIKPSPVLLLLVVVVAIVLVCIAHSQYHDCVVRVVQRIVTMAVVGVTAWTTCSCKIPNPRYQGTPTCKGSVAVPSISISARKLIHLPVLRSTNDDNQSDSNNTSSVGHDDDMNDMNDVNVMSDSDDSCDINDTKCLFDEMEETIDPKRKQEIRMHIVRSIQNSFYSTSPSTSTSTVTPFNDNDDIISNSNYDDNTRSMGDTDPRARTDNGSESTIETASDILSSTSKIPLVDEVDFIHHQHEHHNSDTQPTLQNNGMIERLPLWRVPWTEVVGRTNVLFVHDAIYTNMFELIIREHERKYKNINIFDNNYNNNDNTDQSQSTPPLLFGHVYLPFNGNKNIRSNQIEYKLQSWQEYHHQYKQLSTSSSTTKSSSSITNIMDHTSVIGTLMKINDYRRMNDGKLILYVQGIERFVIQHVHQTVPYGIVQVQLLPDIEEFICTDSATFGTTTTDMIPLQYSTSQYTLRNITNDYFYDEDIIRPKRTTAIVTESWKKWFPYEYSSSIGLPIPSSSLSMSDIVGCALAKVVPFAPFDNTKYPKHLSPEFATLEQITNDSVKNDFIQNNQSIQLPIEVQLIQAGIYIESEILQMIPLSIQQITNVDELERRLWIALNQYYIKSKTSISPYILSLLPPLSILAESWPKGFLLEGIANVMERTATSSRTIGKNSFATPRQMNDINKNTSRMNNTSSTSQLQQQKQTSPITNKGSIDFVRVPVTYPSIRRQKRCSYYIGQIVESFNVDQVQTIRQTLLRIPTTRLRLAYILSLLEVELDSLSSED